MRAVILSSILAFASLAFSPSYAFKLPDWAEKAVQKTGEFVEKTGKTIEDTVGRSKDASAENGTEKDTGKTLVADAHQGQG